MIKENQRILNKINVFTDIIILYISTILSYLIRFYIFDGASGIYKLKEYLILATVIIPFNLIIYFAFNLYSSFRSKRLKSELFSIIKANALIATIIITLMFVFKLINISRWLIVTLFAVNIILVSLKRIILRKTLYSIRAKGLNLKTVIIIGSGETAKNYLDVIKNKKTYGYNYCGYVSDNDNFEGQHLGKYEDLYDVLTKYKVDEVICAIDIEEAKFLEKAVSECEATGTKISIIPFCYKYIPSIPYIDQIANIPLINLRRIPLDNIGNAFMKRFVDIVGSALLIIITSPIMLFTAIGVKCTSKGPVLFKQKRVGLNKVEFTMYKFRSMVINDEQDTAWSKNEDTRKTKFGAFIRKFSIDELPQFFNVLIGNMSLVGPRPEIPHFVEILKSEFPRYMVKHQVKPGITGLAQVNGYRGDTSIRKRIEYDIEYIENWSILSDISILFKTAFKAFKNDEKLKR